MLTLAARVMGHLIALTEPPCMWIPPALILYLFSICDMLKLFIHSIFDHVFHLKVIICFASTGRKTVPTTLPTANDNVFLSGAYRAVRVTIRVCIQFSARRLV